MAADMTTDLRKNPKSQLGWGWYNCGLLIGVERTRRQAICEVEGFTDKSWKECRKYMEVHKVRVEAYQP